MSMFIAFTALLLSVLLGLMDFLVQTG